MKAQQSTYIFDPPGNLTAVIGTNVVAPIITGQPQSALLYSNNVISFSVASTGAGISYQWLSNGIPIIGATNDTLIFPSLTSTNGNFSVIISNSSGSVTSTPAAIWLDSRGVGMPDWWQLKYFGNLTQSPYGDYDGDGVDNLDEYLEGTNPHQRRLVQSQIVYPVAQQRPGGRLARPTVLHDGASDHIDGHSRHRPELSRLGWRRHRHQNFHRAGYEHQPNGQS